MSTESKPIERELVETILPSGRGFRIEKVRTKAYREATARAARALDKDATGAEYIEGQVFQLLMASFEAVTDEPLALVFLKDGETVTTVPDEDAMLAQAPVMAWHKYTYLELKTAGPTHLEEVLSDPEDYEVACSLIRQTYFMRGSANGKAGFSGKKRIRLSM